MSDTLKNKQHWIFDMDGTLTHAIHDFDAIRTQLGLPAGIPILESIATLPTNEAAVVSKQLDDIEYEIADQATAQPYCVELLSLLQQQDCKLGIVTRNGHGIAKATLKAAGIDNFFETPDIISRDCCAPKPAPDGIQLLLSQWNADASTAVMVGDYLFDLASGRNANVATVHLDVNGMFEWPEQTDYAVTSLEALGAILNSI